MFLGKAVHLGPRNNCLDQIYLKYIDYLHSKDAALDNAHTPVLSLYTYDAELSQRMYVSIEQEKNMLKIQCIVYLVPGKAAFC